MKVDKVLSRFATAPEDEGELRRLARALGDELPRQRLQNLQKFRAGLARQKLRYRDGGEGAKSFAGGYVAGLLDVTAEYEVALRQASDDSELQRLAMREDWRGLLLSLEQGPKLPSELATELGKDRPSIARVLKRLRVAGLVQAFADDSIDGRMRPHRLTLDGRRLLARMQESSSGSERPSEVERGIQVAVSLFRHLATHASSSAAELDRLAASILHDPQAAGAAVTTWAERAEMAGLLTAVMPEPEPGSRPELPAVPAVAPGISSEMALAAIGSGRIYHLAMPRLEPLPDPAVLESRHQALWREIPEILTQIADRQEQEAPVYVRTSKGAWGAWAYALQSRDATGMSRAIVEGDVLTGSVAPPNRPFDLVYDDPAMLRADRGKPVMQALMDRADEKYVVSSEDTDVPEDFIQLRLASSHEE